MVCQPAGDGVLVEIRDSGAGIAPEFLPYVFDRFRQADSRATRKHGGLGLGLALARHLVEQHRGDIHAESEGLDRGTTVQVRLPAVSTWNAVSCARVADEQPIELRLDGTVILVVDDQRDSSDLLAALLLRCGAQVIQRDSADAALLAMKVLSDGVAKAAAVQDPPVHLLIADIAMPDVDGYELIARVRQACDRVPAIAVTAYARPEDRRRALAAGYDGYCCKPIETATFLRTGTRRDLPVRAALPEARRSADRSSGPRARLSPRPRSDGYVIGRPVRPVRLATIATSSEGSTGLARCVW